MPNITFLQPDGTRRILDLAPGTTVMAGAVGHGLDGILGECGGNAMCATCHVYVEPDQLGLLPPMSDDEDALLDGAADERRENSRLSCQIRVAAELDGLQVQLPGRQV